MSIQTNYDALDPARILALINQPWVPKSRRGKLRAAIYIRKSVMEKNSTHYSPENQEKLCREYAEREGIEVFERILDLDRSSRNADRDGFQQLLHLVRTREIDLVISAYIDRTYRNGFSFPMFLNLLDRYDVRLASVMEQLDTRTFHGRLMAIILGAMAEWPIWTASLRGRGAKHSRAIDGMTNASFRFGYCNGLCSRCADPNGEGYCPNFGGPDRARYAGKRLIMVPHPVERHAVPMIAHLYHAGWSDKDIAHHVNHHFFTLPDGGMVRFRTKGRPADEEGRGCPPGDFTRDAVREIVNSLFYVGFVTYAESASLDMRDDLEHPARIPGKKHHPRRPDEVYPGRHEALYPFELWMENQQLRAAKANTPMRAGRSARIYLLSDGLGICWECHQHDPGRRAGLRGSTNGSGQQSYRCATLHDRAKARRKPGRPEIPPDVIPEEDTDFQGLVDRHLRSNLPADVLETQVRERVEKLVIPQEWHDQILAYYLSDDGMGEFLLQKRNIFLRVERAMEQHRLGLLDDAALEEERDRALAELEKLKPAACPEAREILPLLADFPALWRQMMPLEQRALLKDIFAGLYFDGKGRLVKARTHPPFAGLL